MSGKEIRTQIKSVKNTQKITRAMEMVAASKMRKAQDRMKEARPYADKIRNVIAHMAHAHPEYKHPFMLERHTKKAGYIIISSDRGLCGGLNSNLFRRVINHMKQFNDENIGIEVCTIGQKARTFFRRIQGSLKGETSHLGDEPRLEELIGTVKVMLDAYENGEIDQLYLVYNRFVNTMTQRPSIEQLLPLNAEKEQADIAHYWDYLYEPDSKEVVDALLMRFIESLVYQGVVENIACEQAARMVAMKAASDNAGNLIDDLQLAYNKARQAAITQELSEIVGGAAAV